MIKTWENKRVLRNCMVEMKYSIERLEDKTEEISHNVEYNLEGFEYQRGRIRMLNQSK